MAIGMTLANAPCWSQEVVRSVDVFVELSTGIAEKVGGVQYSKLVIDYQLAVMDWPEKAEA